MRFQETVKMPVPEAVTIPPVSGWADIVQHSDKSICRLYLAVTSASDEPAMCGKDVLYRMSLNCKTSHCAGSAHAAWLLECPESRIPVEWQQAKHLFFLREVWGDEQGYLHVLVAQPEEAGKWTFGYLADFGAALMGPRDWVVMID
ncbi:MAG: hypothetical protein WC773_01005 [Patescibacteria group bacterium]|jgi:hypothetical protein